MSDIRKLYRGRSAAVWAEKLVEHGWPRRIAERMADFLVTGDNLPAWAEVKEYFPSNEEHTK